MLEKLERITEVVSDWAASAGYAALVFMVLLTCVDVLGAKLFLLPVPGSLDMMMLAQLIAVTFAGALTLRRDRHVSVEFFIMLLPRRAQAAIDCVVQALGFLLFAIVIWRLVDLGIHFQSGGEATPTIAVPVAPFAYAAALAIVPLCLVLVVQFIHSVRVVMRYES